MFAWSQVIASGGNVNKAVKALEQEAIEQKNIKKKKEDELISLTFQAMKEANKSPEEKELDAQREHLHKLAMRELNTLQANE